MSVETLITTMSSVEIRAWQAWFEWRHAQSEQQRQRSRRTV